MDDVCFSAVVIYLQTPIASKFITFGEVEMMEPEGIDVEVRQTDAFFFDKDGDFCREPPTGARCCRLGGSLFILGGATLNDDGCFAFPKNLWSLKVPGDGFPPTLITSVSLNRENISMAMPVPYEDMLLVFQCGQGGGWMDVYLAKSGEILARRMLPPYLAIMDYPCTYFLWKEEEGGREKIVVDFGFVDHETPHILASYDVEQDCWETIDSNFPTTAEDMHIRLIAPLDSSTLLIIDDPALWLVYDIRSFSVIAKVPVYLCELQVKCAVELGGLKSCFYRRCPDTSLNIYMFLETVVLGPADQTEVPYAKMKFQYNGSRGPVVTVEYSGTINTGRDFDDIYIFDGETNTRNEPAVHEKNRKRSSKKKKKKTLKR